MKFPRVRKSIPWCVVVLSLPLTAQALVVARDKLQAKLSAAPFTARIDVVQVRSIPDPKCFARYQAEARVIEVINVRPNAGAGAGTLPRAGDSIRIEGCGGEVSGTGVMYAGDARPRRDLEYVATLTASSPPSSSFGIVGYEAGLRPIQSGYGFSRNRTDGSNGDGAGAYLYWDDSYFPIPYFISAGTFAGYPQFLDAIDLAFQSWRDVASTRVEFLPMGCSTVVRNENDGINNVILVAHDWPFDDSAIAITRNFYLANGSSRAGMILDSDILLNGVDFSFTTANEPGKYDLQSIVTHEAGHFLGLGHEVDPQDPDATMYAVAGPNEINKRTLHADDIAGITTAYPGPGKKLGELHSQCAVASSPTHNVGCMAAHDSGAGPVSLLYALSFLVLLVALGRRVKG